MIKTNALRPMVVSVAKALNVWGKNGLSDIGINKVLPAGAMFAAIMFGHSVHAADEATTTPAVKANTSAKDESTQALPVVNVKTSKVKAQDGYQATKTRVGKVLQDPHDVPQAITTVTHSLMKDQQVGSLREALRNVSGLTFNAAEGGRGGDNFMLRGFYTFGDIYLDGIRDTAQYYRETFNLEQVDVLRGSAAMLFGRGQAGGVINQVSKTAKLTDSNLISASLGNYNYNQETGDFNKKLGDTTAIRINVMERNEQTYRTNSSSGAHPEYNRQGIALSFGTGIGTDNEFFLNHVTTEARDVPDFGVNFQNARPINTAASNNTSFYGNSNNFDDSKTNITTGIFTHKFSNDSEWRTQLRSADYERSYWAKTPTTTSPTANNSAGGNQTRYSDYETLTLQTDYSNKLDLAGMKHTVLAGAEYLKENSFRQALQGYDPVTGAALTTVANGTPVVYYADRLSLTGAQLNSFKADNYAVYAQDTIQFAPQWDLLFGIRRDELRADYSSATSPSLSYGENSYRSGLSWHQSADRHYYLSYSDSFSPTADLYQLTVAAQPPERSKTLELGSKWLLSDGDLALRTAVYTTTKDWERNTDLLETNTNNVILTKKRRTNGLEVELSGLIAENWEAFAGVAFMDAKILEAAENINATTGAITTADQRFVGQRARNTPPVTLNIWTTYSFFGKWKVGGGVEAKAERTGYSPTAAVSTLFTSTGDFNPNMVPGYARLDAMLAYEEKKWALRLNVKNLLDKTYYGDLYDNGTFSVPGNRRQAIVTTEFKF